MYLRLKTKQLFVTLMLISAVMADIAAQQFTISGTITDAKTGEPLLSANVYNSKTLSGTASNVYGFYSLTQPAGTIPLTISFIGYEAFKSNLILSHDTLLNIALKPVIELDEVVISGQSPMQNMLSTDMGSIKLSPQKAEVLPALLGETDIIKTFQLMPGTQGGTEGTSGFYVRGGGPDQNLILLDGVPVYNVNHLFGFMSVFNSDAIRNVTLIKGGFPARYGGRLSSVLDIRMKEGNNKEFKGSASVGLISSKLTMEGPIVKDKTSFMVSGRRSYIDLLSYPFQMMNNDQNDENEKLWFGYYLQDFNIKVNHIFNYKHRIYFSLYTGKDKFFINDKYHDNNEDGPYYYKYENKGKLQWGNTTGALRWNYIISNRLFSNLTTTVSNYKLSISEKNKEEEGSDNYQPRNSEYYYEYYSQIKDFALKTDFDFVPNPSHHIRFGAQNTIHYFSPGITVNRDRYSSDVTPVDTTYGNKNLRANEFLFYAEDEIVVTRFLKINTGVHYSNFNIQGTTYQSIEPRISARVLLSDKLSAKASYVEMRQYLHLLANSSMGLPTDLWVPATQRISPQDSKQLSVGLFYSPGQVYEYTAEAYYKKMNHIIDYAEGSSFFELNQGNWEDLITKGEGESYGIELMARKHKGKLSGWIGYTLSWAHRKFEDVNFGKTFPFKYDARHDLSVVTITKLSEKIDIGVTWVYRTGYPFTMEDEAYPSLLDYFREPHSSGNTEGESKLIEHFEHRNNYRMPDYHRLDVGINFHKQKKKVYRTWSYGLYNAYARNNPFMIYSTNKWDDDTNETDTRLKRLSIFNLIPYVRWSIKF
jgi:outer membrane cobalamin receptor